MAAKKQRGRPHLPKSEALTSVIQVRVTDAEHRNVKARAKTAGLSVSEWARERLIE